MVLGDDVRFDTPGWDNVLREIAAKFPDGIFLASPHDPMTADTCTYPVFGWRWLETLQHFFCGHFPFWYDDRWVHQIGEMAGRYAWLPIVVLPVRGKGRHAADARRAVLGALFPARAGRTQGFRQKTH